jgi:hypothetical protein
VDLPVGSPPADPIDERALTVGIETFVSAVSKLSVLPSERR